MRNLATWASQEAFSNIWQQVTSICLKSKNHLRKNATKTKSELKCSKKFWFFFLILGNFFPKEHGKGVRFFILYFSYFVQIVTLTKWLKGDDADIRHLMQLWKNNLWVFALGTMSCKKSFSFQNLIKNIKMFFNTEYTWCFNAHVTLLGLQKHAANIQ
jgi:hypothetical protein